MTRTPQRHRRLLALAVAAVAVAACSGDDDGAATTSSSAARTTTTTTSVARSTTTIAPTVQAVGLRRLEPFAAYRWVPELSDATPYGGPEYPTSLDDVLLTEGQREWLAPEVRAQIEEDGFAVDGDPRFGSRFFHDSYKGTAEYNITPVFVTTDAAYHSWHLVFDKVLRDLEQQRLLPVLERLVTSSVTAAREQEAELAGSGDSTLVDAAHRATAYFEATAVLLGLDVGAVSDLTTQEVALAEAAAALTTSPVSGVVECQAPNSFVGCVDFSLFRPRGHYTRTPDLERYFTAMSLLGQEGFALQDGLGVLPGLMVARVIVIDPDRLADWTTIYEPTAFLVGLADDISPLELATAADDAVPGWRGDAAELAGVDAEGIAAAVLADHPVAIDPERAAVKVMGARFTLDSFVLDQLAWPNVGTEDDRRVHVAGLDLAAAFGSPLARELQLSTESGYAHYTDQLDAMRGVVASRTPDDWAGTVYDAWLAAIAPQFGERGQAFPAFMRSDAWAAKALQTGLASYTELKHDTVLYAKQGTGGEGEGPPKTFEPRHWVEPDPVSFGRIAAAADLLRDGLADRELLTAEADDLLATLSELTTWLAGVAAEELDGRVASDADNQRLLTIGSELEYIWFASADLDPEVMVPAAEDDQASLVTDVFTASFEYLQLGTGWVQRIYVIVPLGDGRFELAVGAVSSYYEFWRPSSEPRLTDAEWRAMLRAEEADPTAVPPRPAWQESFVVGADIATEPIIFQEPS